MQATGKIRAFFQESKIELKKVNWPSREETVKYTVFVIILSVGLALFLGLADLILLRGIELIIK